MTVSPGIQKDTAGREGQRLRGEEAVEPTGQDPGENWRDKHPTSSPPVLRSPAFFPLVESIWKLKGKGLH